MRSALAAGEPAATRLLGVRGPHLARALAEWERLDDAPTLPAAERYSGVVWGGLDAAALDAAARRRLARRVLVPSGLWGLVAATDPLPAYRLKMGARVAPLGALAAWWRPAITPLIDVRADGGWIIDLLPEVHASAVDPALLRRSRLLRVVLVEDGPGAARRALGHAGKTLKGRLARAILEADAADPESVAALEVDGLRAGSTSASDAGGTVTMTFVREPIVTIAT